MAEMTYKKLSQTIFKFTKNNIKKYGGAKQILK